MSITKNQLDLNYMFCMFYEWVKLCDASICVELYNYMISEVKRHYYFLNIVQEVHNGELQNLFIEIRKWQELKLKISEINLSIEL